MWMNGTSAASGKVADDLCWMRSLHTDAINHEPAICAMQTGNQVTGRPCLGSWAVLRPRFAEPRICRPSSCWSRRRRTASRSRRSPRALWSSGILPGEHAGVSLPQQRRSDPVHQQPGRVFRKRQRRKHHAGWDLEAAERDRITSRFGDPETHTRIQPVRDGLPHAVQCAGADGHQQEPAAPTFKLYGEEAKKPGTFANSALMARRSGRARRALRADLPQQLGPPRNVGGRMPEPVQGCRPARAPR